MEHTPRPWKANKIRNTFAIEHGEHHVASFVYKEKDALLISAAPDLLEALIEVVRISDRNHIAWDHAKVAIAKAKGMKII